ncbi:HAD hydrolase family protein, partial [Leuconostoc mesenteroides]
RFNFTIYHLYLNAKTERVIREKIIAVSDIERYAPLAIDILPKGVSKGQAINLLLEKVSDSRVTTYAFGNQNNDISMFKTVNYGMSMKESTAELKKLSSYVAKTDNGVLEGLKHFKLI